MFDITNIVDDALIICPQSIQKALCLEQITKCPFKNIKFISKEAFFKEVYYTYDLEAIVYLNHEYGYNYELTTEILNNLTGIKTGTEKLDQLNAIYLKLQEQKLLKSNPYWLDYLKKKTIYIYKYSQIDQELCFVLGNFGLQYTFLIDDLSLNNHQVNCFTNLEEEVRFVFLHILELLEKGVSMNNIYIYRLPSEYHLIFEKYLHYHNLYLEGFSKLFLYDTSIYKRFVNLLKANDVENAYQLLLEEVTYDPFDVLSSIVDIVVKTSTLSLEKEELIQVLNYLAKNKEIKDYQYDECLKICDPKSLIQDDDYVFMLGFSENVYPITIKDVGLYSDAEKTLLNKNTSLVETAINKEELIKFIQNTKHLMITYKEKMGKIVYYPSLLIKELKMEKVYPSVNNKRYSESLAKLEVATYYDEQRIYGVHHKYLRTFSKEDLQYGIFNRQFKPFNIPLKDVIKLSYTKIDEYNHCPFKYYLSKVLHINVLDETFNLDLGTLFHKILEDSNSQEIDLKDYEVLIEKLFTSNATVHFVKKLIKQLPEVIIKNSAFQKITSYNQVLVEEECSFKLDEKTIMEGKIDKAMIDENHNSLIIIDYKTGSLKFEPNKIAEGFSLQLPVYILLAKYQYPDFNCDGIFIQNVCDKEADSALANRYLLSGIFIADEEKIKNLDPEVGKAYDDECRLITKSRYIQGVSLANDLTIKNTSNLISDANLNILLDQTIEQIQQASSRIHQNIFDIRPAYFNEFDNACVYCHYKDICFKKYSDYRKIIVKKGGNDED